MVLSLRSVVEEKKCYSRNEKWWELSVAGEWLESQHVICG